MIDTVHLYLIGIPMTGCGFLMAGLIYLAKQFGEARASTERIADSMERIVGIIDRDLQDITALLRGP